MRGRRDPSSGGRSPARILRWWLACWRQAITRDLQFRTQTVLIMLGALVDVGVSLIPALVLASTARTSTSGWDTADALLVVGLFTISTAVLDAVIAPNLQRLDSAVREGELDLLLIRPIPPFLALLLRWVRPAELTRVFAGFALVVAASMISTSGTVTVAGIFGALALMAIGCVAWTLAWLNLSMLSFWWASAEPVQEIVGALREAGQYPRAAFGRGPSLMFGAVVPALLLAAVPADVLLGGDVLWPLWGAGAVVAVLGSITAVHWRLALRRYDSASS